MGRATSLSRKRHYRSALAQADVVLIKPSEWQLHQDVAEALRRAIAPAGKVSKGGVIWWSIDHAAYGGKAPGARQSRGVIAGIPDIYVLHDGEAHHIELKREGGSLSLPQQAVATAVLVARGRYGVACSAIEVLSLLDRWGIPHRGAMKNVSTG